MRQLPADLLARERERATRIRLDPDAPVDPGDVWAVRHTIVAQDEPSRIIEHSRVPLAVVVVRLAGALVEVAPVSHEVDLAGEFDVLINDHALLGQPFMVEAWLRMPVTTRALAGRIGSLQKSDAARVKAAVTTALTTDATALPELDPRRAYRQDERMRVIFAIAGTGEELVLSPGHAEADAGALQIKRQAAKWVARPAPRKNGKIVGPYEGYDDDAERPAAAGRAPTTTE